MCKQIICSLCIRHKASQFTKLYLIFSYRPRSLHKSVKLYNLLVLMILGIILLIELYQVNLEELCAYDNASNFHRLNLLFNDEFHFDFENFNDVSSIRISARNYG